MMYWYSSGQISASPFHGFPLLKVHFLSCGFDACEHEYESMQRHQRRVPTSFYYQFARDACKFADKHAQGRIISVLEGGYSDRALISGAMAHLIGLSDVEDSKVDHKWWSLENIMIIEAATKKRRGGRTSQTITIPPDAWIQRTLEIFAGLDTTPPVARAVIPASSISLRERQKPVSSTGASKSPERKPVLKEPSSKLPKGKAEAPEKFTAEEPVAIVPATDAAPKKLPRVILRVGPNPGSNAGT